MMAQYLGLYWCEYFHGVILSAEAGANAWIWFNSSAPSPTSQECTLRLGIPSVVVNESTGVEARRLHRWDDLARYSGVHLEFPFGIRVGIRLGSSKRNKRNPDQSNAEQTRGP